MSSDRSAYEIFDRTLLRVPDYQRGYAWEVRHLEEFWEDLEVLPGHARHYTGTVVLLRRPEERVRDDAGVWFDTADIVDGQQRLTTMVLLLSELRRRLETAGAVQPAERIAEHYLWINRDGTRQAILELGSDIDGFWQRRVLADEGTLETPSIRSEQRLLDARNFFADRLEALIESDGADVTDRLLALNDKVTDQLRFTLYEVDDASQVGVIFETLNDRGKPLTELEKVKNYLLFLASGLPEGHRRRLSEEVNHSWAQVYERLMGAGITRPSEEDGFLRAHWLMTTDPRPRNWDGTGSIKARFPRRDYWDQLEKVGPDVRAYASSLEQAARAFSEIHKPHRDDAFSGMGQFREQVRVWSERLRRLGALATFQPLLMAVRLTHADDPQLSLDIVQLCERYALRVYRLRGVRANTGQARMYRLGHDVYRGELTGDELRERIRAEILSWCPRTVFDRTFAAEGHEVNWYRWSGLRYLLYEYEMHLARGRQNNLTWEQLSGRSLQESVEHILPQSPRDGDWTAFDAEERRRLTHDLGNLVLTLDNSRYSNRSFEAKRGTPGSTVGGSEACYARSLLIQEREVADYDNWTPETVRDRREQLIEWARKRWAVEGEEDEPTIAMIDDADDLDQLDEDYGFEP